MLHPHFDRFDIAEAYAVLEWHWNVDGILRERPSNARRRMSTGVQLRRMGFRASPNLEFDSLSRNGRAIYLNATRTLGLRRSGASLKEVK